VSLFDLLFILLFLAAVSTLVAAAFAAVRHRGDRALRLLRGLGVTTAIYLGIVLLVALAVPRRVAKVGNDLCFDDWCVAVADVKRTKVDTVASYDVTIRLSSRARGRVQRANGASVYMTDSLGRRYDPRPDSSALPLTTYLEPGESIEIKRIFQLPADARDPGVVLTHGEGIGPGWFIIGEGPPPFHKPAIVQVR
jgi:hypothetical protein